MAQRISRAKRAVAAVRWDRPGDLLTVLRVLYLVFNEGYSGDVDLTVEAIRLTRELAALTDDVEVTGVPALMLLHQARQAARRRGDGILVPLAEQDRSRWDTDLIAEGVAVLQAALAGDRLGEFQAQAAIAALHADAPVDAGLPRRAAGSASLHEKDGDLVTAAREYADAARAASNLAERDHVTRQAARLHRVVRG